VKLLKVYNPDKDPQLKRSPMRKHKRICRGFIQNWIFYSENY
jgi:hypothetical protein